MLRRRRFVLVKNAEWHCGREVESFTSSPAMNSKSFGAFNNEKTSRRSKNRLLELVGKKLINYAAERRNLYASSCSGEPSVFVASEHERQMDPQQEIMSVKKRKAKAVYGRGNIISDYK